MNTKKNKYKSAIEKSFLLASQRTAALFTAPSKAHIQSMLFLSGVMLISVGLSAGLSAQGFGGGGGGHHIEYNDVRLAESVNAILTYIEGTFGALVMVAAGIGAILSSAFGQYRAALGLLVVAVGSFILRSFIATFFNDDNLTP